MLPCISEIFWLHTLGAVSFVRSRLERESVIVEFKTLKLASLHTIPGILKNPKGLKIANVCIQNHNINIFQEHSMVFHHLIYWGVRSLSPLCYYHFH